VRQTQSTLPSWRQAQSRRRQHAGVVGLPFIVIATVYLAIATAVGAVTASALHNRSTAAAVHIVKPPRYLVLMVLDGARPDYLGEPGLPHLAQLEAQGMTYSNAIDGILEAETPAGHATIATGSRPDHDGVLGFDWVTDNTRYSVFDPSQMGTMQQIMESAGATTIAGLYKRKYPSAKVVALSGHKYYAAAPLGGPSADAIIWYEGDSNNHYVPVGMPGHLPPSAVLNAPGLVYPTTRLPDGTEDHLATKLAIAAVRAMHPRLLLINYPEFDWPLGHVDGGPLNQAKVATDMQGWDADLGRIEELYRKEGILDKTLFVITADHGMMPIKHFVPATEIDDAITSAGTTAPDIATNSSDFIWLADPTKAQTVTLNILAKRDPGIASAYYLTTVNGRPAYRSAGHLPPAMDQANQYLLDALLNGHEPQVVVFGTEGTSFSDPSTGWKADHGGNTWESQHVPLVLAGPGIRSGTSNAAVQLDDLAPTILADMGVRPSDMEGRVLTDALLTPKRSDVKARRTEIRSLDPIVTALRHADSP